MFVFHTILKNKMFKLQRFAKLNSKVAFITKNNGNFVVEDSNNDRTGCLIRQSQTVHPFTH